MPDHWHILLRVPSSGSVSKVMNSWKSAVVMNTGLQKIWQSRFYVRFIDNDPSNVASYIHQNPVKAGLVDVADQYPWSSVSGKWQVDDLLWTGFYIIPRHTVPPKRAAFHGCVLEGE